MKKKILKTSKNLLKVVTILSLSFLFVNCDKDDSPADLAPLQDPLPGFIVASGFDEETSNRVNREFFVEAGISFIPMINGKITAIVVKIPDANPNLRVTIWDNVTKSVIKTIFIDVPAANVEVIRQISSIDLIKDREYIVSFNTNDYYLRFKTNQNQISYPFLIGDIQINNVLLNNGTAQTLPGTKTFNTYYGDCSFKFQK